MPHWPTITQSSATQARVVHALILREVKTRFGRQKLGYLWAFLEPILFVGILVALYKLAGTEMASGMPVVLFLLTGFPPFFLFRNTMQQTLSAIESNRVLLTFPQVTLFDLVLTRALLEIATMTVVFFVLVATAHLAGYSVAIEDPLQVLVVLGVLALTGAGLGALFAGLAALFQSVKNVVPILAGRPLLFTSGVFFTAEMMPEQVREVLLLNPLLHMLEWLRSAFFVEFESRYMDIDYAVATALVTVFLGFLVLRALRSRILAAV